MVRAKIKCRTLLIGLALVGATFTACSNDGSDSAPAPAPSADKALEEGTWQVSYFYDKDKDETYHFSGYAFTFKSDGKVSAVKGNAVKNGTWAYQTTSSNHDELVLNFGPAEPFEELNDDWHIIEQTATSLKLEDESGSGGIEKLYFTRK